MLQKGGGLKASPFFIVATQLTPMWLHVFVKKWSFTTRMDVGSANNVGTIICHL